MKKEMGNSFFLNAMEGSNPHLTVSIGSDSTYETDDDSDSLSEASSRSEVGGEGAKEESSTKFVGGGTSAVSSSRSSTRARSQQDIPILVQFEASTSGVSLAAADDELDTASSGVSEEKRQSAVDSLARLDWMDDDKGDDLAVQRQGEGITKGHEQCLQSGENLMDSLYQELAQLRRESLKLTLQHSQMFDDMSTLTMQNELLFPEQEEEDAEEKEDAWSHLEEATMACLLCLLFVYLVFRGQVWIFPIILVGWWLVEILLPCEVFVEEEEALRQHEQGPPAVGAEKR
jgi:hypothetical protein